MWKVKDALSHCISVLNTFHKVLHHVIKDKLQKVVSLELSSHA